MANFDAIKEATARDPVRAYELAGLRDLRQDGPNRWKAVCPLHEDDDPSLKVFADGGWCCFGCDRSGDLVDFYVALHRCDNLQAAEQLTRLLNIGDDLPAPAPSPATKRTPKTNKRKPPTAISDAAVSNFVAALEQRPELVAWLNQRRGFSPGLVQAARIGIDPGAGRLVLPVYDGQGRCRDLRRWRIPDDVCSKYGLEPSSSDATWLPARPGDGTGAPRVYDPFQHLAQDSTTPVFLAEGEWDALRLREAGVEAFTITDGAAKWPDGRTENHPPDLTGRVVLVVGDNDQAGTKHNETGALNCYLAGAAQVFAIRWPEDFANKGDASDWLNASRTLEDLVALAVEIQKPRAVVPWKKRWTGTELAAAEFPDPVWVVPGVIPEGTTLLAGRPKLGKSWLALQLAQAKAMGGYTLGETVEPGKVLYCALEDNARRIKDRMTGQHWPAAACAAVTFILETSIDDLEALLEAEHFDFAVIDTFSKLVMASGLDQNSGDDMTTAWGRLHGLSIRTGTSILVLEHHRKAWTGDPVQDIAGSTAKAAVVDCVAGLYRERGQSKATLSVTGRDVEEREIELYFKPGDLMWYPVEEFRGGIEYKHDEGILQVLEAGPNSLSGIARALGGVSKSVLSKALARMATTGKLHFRTDQLWELPPEG